ncbi:hypothetical protein CUS89_01135 [Enterococcus mundtii]|uniref:Uncharacterized protein n=1 Tax=Enterococcus mundtii TaxID=53346 RepID=A0A2S7RZF4_ENTMU|nr:hypothetical protein CUS89_01135 [Enterococcus mundtii]
MLFQMDFKAKASFVDGYGYECSNEMFCLFRTIFFCFWKKVVPTKKNSMLYSGIKNAMDKGELL